MSTASNGYIQTVPHRKRAELLREEVGTMIDTVTAIVMLICLASVLVFCELIPALAKPDPSSERASA